MRMDGASGETAADLVNRLPEHELERIIRSTAKSAGQNG